MTQNIVPYVKIGGIFIGSTNTNTCPESYFLLHQFKTGGKNPHRDV